jgi:Flp pilus assembly protein TadD
VERDRALAAQARDTYVEGLGEWPANGRGWLGYGRVLARLGDEASAERALHRAERLLPRDAAPKVELALLDLRRGDTAAACGHLSAALGRREAPSLEDLQRLLREAGRDPTCLRRTG